MITSMNKSGRNNSNCKYKTLNDNFFECIATEEQAYLLGWIASDGTIAKRGITITIHVKDKDCLEHLRNIICPELPIKSKKTKIGYNQCSLVINSNKCAVDVCNILQISFGKKDKIVKMPKLANEELQWAFIRGYFDGDGSIISPCKSKTYPVCKIASYSSYIKDSIRDFTKIPCSVHEEAIEWSGVNALDFLGKLYDNAKHYLSRKRNLYLDWCCWAPGIGGTGTYGTENCFRWVKTNLNAIPPSKSRSSDSGYDLTIIEKGKTVGDVEFYHTGIKVQPNQGLAFFIFPRSSISKTGYILANGVGVIDKSYTGEVLIALRKIDKSSPEIQLPCKIAQLVPLPIVHVNFVEVDNLESTHRSDGGFGSTGK